MTSIAGLTNHRGAGYRHCAGTMFSTIGNKDATAHKPGRLIDGHLATETLETDGDGQSGMRRAILAVLALGLAVLLAAMPRATASQPATPKCGEGGSVMVPVATGGTLCISPGSGESFKDCGDCPEMVVVPAGKFMMGSPNSEPNRQDDETQFRASVPSTYAVGKYEVTFAEWDTCVATGGCAHKPGDMSFGRGRRPVMNVSWNDILDQYLPWLSSRTGKNYRLLTEIEWEYVARARSTAAYHWGNEFDPAVANNGGRTARVGTYAANAFGLHDVHGNVWEWVHDCYSSRDPTSTSSRNHVTAGKCKRRILRGGGWNSRPRVLRSAFRYWGYPNNRNDSFGFRVARTLAPVAK